MTTMKQVLEQIWPMAKDNEVIAAVIIVERSLFYTPFRSFYENDMSSYLLRFLTVL